MLAGCGGLSDWPKLGQKIKGTKISMLAVVSENSKNKGEFPSRDGN